MERNDLEKIKAAVFGVVVGDALGVPVEFSSREERKADPVIDMREYGTHYQPKGTWSDDSSMTLATMESIIQSGGINYEDMMNRFHEWRVNGAYTPHGSVFDIGITCSGAIDRFRPGIDPRECGATGENENGNGSLMRIMPVSLYDALLEDYWQEDVLGRAMMHTHDASSLTHRHPRSLIGCMLHTSICHELIFRGSQSIQDAVQNAVNKTLQLYEKVGETRAWYNDEFRTEIEADRYARLRDLESLKTQQESKIQSSGYVVHTLEAAIWCLLNSESYADCVLKAVNLGDDTDTVGAVAGGLAGLAYGYESIPADWTSVIASKDWIEQLCEEYAVTVSHMVNEEYRKKLARLDWENEKTHQQKILNSDGISENQKKAAAERIKEADKYLRQIKDSYQKS